MNKVLHLLFVVVVGGCVTPVIPLPPPNPSLMSLTADTNKGEIVISGKASDPHSDALYYFYNLRTGYGTIALAQPDGSFTTQPLEAKDGDKLDLWTSRFGEDEPSSVVRVIVRYSGSLERTD
jgi:hypothetical protein